MYYTSYLLHEDVCTTSKSSKKEKGSASAKDIPHVSGTDGGM